MTTDPALTPSVPAPPDVLVHRLLDAVAAVDDPVDREAAALELERVLAEAARAAGALARLSAHSRRRPREYVDEEDAATFARPPWA
ncbi:hypothetical protein [Phycicoccus sonneratiae]|uniref:Uncharacterized protein n=1 Tax=Phycicoccus sonneratiae TaxID=2807628 RepID=A0ABS2CG50_9MICO|nr:hypothetical protein [Phycicoccus sonneraticus]MBM6398847.1 hypothetical protein [Phycicoccus sonneraticus]